MPLLLRISNNNDADDVIEKIDTNTFFTPNYQSYNEILSIVGSLNCIIVDANVKFHRLFVAKANIDANIVQRTFLSQNTVFVELLDSGTCVQ